MMDRRLDRSQCDVSSLIDIAPSSRLPCLRLMPDADTLRCFWTSSCWMQSSVKGWLVTSWEILR